MSKLIFLLILSLNLSLFSQVKLGIDILQENKFKILDGKRVALYSNFASRDSKGELTFNIFKKQNNFKFISNFTPEHGFYTTQSAGKHIENDTIYNIPIISLYGQLRKPTDAMLDSIDVIVCDIQDVGVRSYTFISTMFNLMSSAADLKKEFIVLDRPNPLGGISVDGNNVNDEYRSFVSVIPVPYIHACTIGELAEIINGEHFMGNDQKGKFLKANLKVIKMQNWSREMVWEDTKLNWFPTSPNIPTVNAIRAMAFNGIIGELGILSIGIGTNTPFQFFGNIDFDTKKFENSFKIDEFKEVQFNKTYFSPFFGMNENKVNKGYFINILPSPNFKPFTVFYSLIKALKNTYPEYFDESKLKGDKPRMFKKVTGTKEIYDYLFNNKSELPNYSLDVENFTKLRSKYLLYK